VQFVPKPPALSNRPSVLVIEDRADMRDLLKRILERAGYAVVTAADGVEGMARFRAGEFDLVVTDIMMPVMDGFEVIRTLRAEGSDVPIVAVSGVDDWHKLLRMALGLGANAGLQKPVARDLFLRTVSDLMGLPPARAVG
jgi:CheY-like chemotaxis protein